MHGGEGWMVKLICEIHNHELAKSLVGHPYAGQLTKDGKKIIPGAQPVFLEGRL